MLLSVENLVTEFKMKRGVIKAVNDVTFNIDKGEILALVGESGSGKSVTAMSVMRLVTDPGNISGGIIKYKENNLLDLPKNKIQEIRGNEISMIFQEPMTSLNPVYSIKKQLLESIQTHMKLSKKEAYDRAVEMMTLVGIPSPAERIESYPHEMSGGMRQRVMIAMALSCNPELLIADEPTTALDVTIQAQIMDLLLHLRKKINMGVLLITHDLGIVAEVADRVCVMYCGKIVEEANVIDLFKSPKHPYTVGLINSIPKLDVDVDRLEIIGGMVPNPLHMPKGCSFSSRCTKCIDICKNEMPELLELEPGKKVRCHLYNNQLEGGQNE